MLLSERASFASESNPSAADLSADRQARLRRSSLRVLPQACLRQKDSGPIIGKWWVVTIPKGWRLCENSRPVIARSEATKRSLQTVLQMRDCFGKNRLAMTEHYFLHSLDALGNSMSGRQSFL